MSRMSDRSPFALTLVTAPSPRRPGRRSRPNGYSRLTIYQGTGQWATPLYDRGYHNWYTPEGWVQY